MFKKIKEWWINFKVEQDLEYHKRLLNFIIINSIGMMWMSYILAWFDHEEIAQNLSNTVATSIVAVVIPYLITKTIENVSKYGSRLNKTTKDFDNVSLEKSVTDETTEQKNTDEEN
jgi:hypothetical protein